MKEFWIKHRAFTRAENRALSLVLELALRTTNYAKKDQNAIKKDINALRRYPIKQWLIGSD